MPRSDSASGAGGAGASEAGAGSAAAGGADGLAVFAGAVALLCANAVPGSEPSARQRVSAPAVADRQRAARRRADERVAEKRCSDRRGGNTSAQDGSTALDA